MASIHSISWKQNFLDMLEVGGGANPDKLGDAILDLVNLILATLMIFLWGTIEFYITQVYFLDV